MRLLSVTIAMIMPVVMSAQQQGTLLIDSLKRELPGKRNDTTGIRLLDKLSFAYSTINPDSGIVYGKLALEASKQLHWQQGLAVANADLGVNHSAKSEYVTALNYHQAALKQYELLKDKKGMSAVLTNIALVYHAQGNYVQAMDNNLKALNIGEGVNDKNTEAIILENIGTLYLERKVYDKARDYYTKAEKHYRESGGLAGIARSITNLAIVADAEGDYTLALKKHFDALAINKQLTASNSVQISYANIGVVYMHLHQFDSALAYHLKALDISNKSGIKSSIAINTGNAGETYLEIAKQYKKKGNLNASGQNLDKAIAYLDKAVKICREIQLLPPATEFLSCLSDAYYQSGNYKQAYDTYREYIAVKDSVFSAQSALELTKIENQREIELQEKNILLKDKQIRIAQLELAGKRNHILLYISGIIVLALALISSIIVIGSYKRSNRILAIEKRKIRNLTLNQLRDITLRNKMLEELANLHSHDVRGHVTTILGLSQLINRNNYADPANKTLIEGIISSTEELDLVIKEIVKRENELVKQ